MISRGRPIVLANFVNSIPFNLWRADHWLNKPIKKKMRPCKEDYRYYLTHNIFITTSGNFNTRALKFCIDELGVDRCMFSIGQSVIRESRRIQR